MAVIGDAFLVKYLTGDATLYIFKFGKSDGPGLGEYTLKPGSELSATDPYNANGPPNLHMHNGTLLGTEAALTTGSAKVTKIYTGVTPGPLVTPSSSPTVSALKAHLGGTINLGGSLTGPSITLGTPPAGGGTPGGGNKTRRIHAGSNPAAVKILAGSVAATRIYVGSTLVWEA